MYERVTPSAPNPTMLIICSARIPEAYTGMLAAGFQLNDPGWTVTSLFPLHKVRIEGGNE